MKQKKSAIIPLQYGQFTVIDAEDYERVLMYHWCSLKKGRTSYAVSNPTIDGVRRKIRLHRIIMRATDPNILVDHINGDGLDNRKSNLRLCRSFENLRNKTSPSKNNTSGYKGVCYKKSHKKWCARIWTPKELHLGYFNTPEDAARAYNRAAKKYFGEFAALNPIKISE